MCGIMGYIGNENATDIVIKGLENLEYRGYDSAGIAVNDGNKMNIIKTVGSPSKLWKQADNIHGFIGIGHTRWATHGAPTIENAHPHVSKSGLFTVVHNGIIENYSELKAELEEKGIEFSSETDTEVIAHLLEDRYNGDLKGVVKDILPLLKGSYALGILCMDYPDVIVCAKMSSPLFAGTSGNCGFLASDVSAIADSSERLYKLNDGEIGLLSKDSFKVFDIEGCRIRKSEIKIKAYDKTLDKGGFEHYMFKEIMEQPSAVKRTLSEIITDTKKIKFRGFKMSKEFISNIKNVKFIACGSAYHVGMIGAYACEMLFKCSAEACVASEFRYKHPYIDKNTLVVIISQSGETADTLAALRIAVTCGAKVVSIVNVENSTIAQESENVIMTRAGKEIAVATTKAYSAQLAVVYSLVIYLATASGKIDKRTSAEYIEHLLNIPDKIENILLYSEQIKKYAEMADKAKYICFIGRGFDYCAAMEASLKLKEVSYIPCESYAAGELKHGTISLVDDKSLIIAMCCSRELMSKTISNVNEVEARGAKVIKVTSEESSGEITVPDTLDFLFPMLEVIQMQLLAYYTALKRGCEIDKPKNLAKSVTVE